MAGLCFPHTPTFSDELIAFDPAAGVFIVRAEPAQAAPDPSPPPIVAWQPRRGGQALRRLAVALGVERPQ